MIDVELIKQVFFILKEKDIKLITCESLTGGLISSEFTKIPGTSEVFWGGYVVYTPQAKISLLNVNPETLKDFGLVSVQTVEAMNLGAVKNFLKASSKSISVVSIAVSGAAGPSSLEGKPPGTVCISAAFFNSKNFDLKILDNLKKDSLIFKTSSYKFLGSRNEVREETLNKAFEHILSLTKNYG